MLLCRSSCRSWWITHSLCKTGAGLHAVLRKPCSCMVCRAVSSQRAMCAWPSPQWPAKLTGHTRVPAPKPIAHNSSPGPRRSQAACKGRRCHPHLHLPLFLINHLLLQHALHAHCPQSLWQKSSDGFANGAGLHLTYFPQRELMRAFWIYLMAPS